MLPVPVEDAVVPVVELEVGPLNRQSTQSTFH